MSKRLRAFLSAALIVGLLETAAAGQGVDPTVAVDRTGTTAGEQLLVTGGGWPAGATVLVELCGRGGIGGSADCDVGRQRSAGVGPSGTFSVQLTSGKPPSACPCVVKATDQSSQVAATAAIAVAGMPTVPIEPGAPPGPSLEVSTISISGGGRWTELFGAGGRRVLEITLVNTGPARVDAPKLALAWGRGADPDGFVEPPETVPMEPGETQTLTVALDRPALTIGTQTAVVEIVGVGEDLVARASTTSYPWGLVVLALVALQLLALRLRNRVRRRLVGAPAAPPPPAHSSEGLRALAAAPEAGGDDDQPTTPADGLAEQRVVDLDGLDAAVTGRALTPFPTNGVAPQSPSFDEAMDVNALLSAEVHDLRRAVSDALREAASRSEALLAQSAEHARAVERRADEQLLEAARCRTEAVELLAAARVRADAVVADAERAAEATRREATFERHEATRRRIELDERHHERVEEMTRHLETLLRDLEARAAALQDRADAVLWRHATTDRRRPDALDRQMANALERAITDVTSPPPERT